MLEILIHLFVVSPPAPMRHKINGIENRMQEEKGRKNERKLHNPVKYFGVELLGGNESMVWVQPAFVAHLRISSS